MTHDISHIIHNWEFDPGKSYRKIVGDDGREKMQVRVDNAAFQGVLQMELDGRPDGKQPYGYDFAFDYYRLALKRFQRAHGTARGFKLEPESCSELFDESLRIYNRYIFLLQLQDYQRVIRDTERNMELFRFVNKYAVREKDRMNLERWWPYIIRINGTARALLAMQEHHDLDEALKVASQTLERIENLEPVDFEEFQTELERSQKALEEMIRSIKANKPLTAIEKLQNQLVRAVEEERFEDAARLRDQLKGFEQQKIE
ncbi:MAG: UvrB/UvrC motif-containing protein [Candidatus Glassbacteria bacterium]